MRAVREARAKILLGVVTLVAIGRAVTAPPPDAGNHITPEMAHSAWHDITGRERSMRREAAVKFPGDLWSQDDDMHERENEAVRSYASKNNVRITDVVRAMDDGMHAHWPTSGTVQATVPPCRPRLSY